MCSSSRMRSDSVSNGLVVQHFDRMLQHDDAAVDARVYKVHGASAELHAVGDRLPLRVHAGEGGQQRRVHIQHAVTSTRSTNCADITRL